MRGQGHSSTIITPNKRNSNISLPQCLYHATAMCNYRDILGRGLVPSPSRYQGRNETPFGQIYLGHHDVAESYAEEIEATGQESLLLQITDLYTLDSDNWLADEDTLEHTIYNRVGKDGLHVNSITDDTLIHTDGKISYYQPNGKMAYEYFGLTRPPRSKDPMTLAEWAGQYDLSKTDIVNYSLSRGSVAYRGLIPASHIKKLTRGQTPSSPSNARQFKGNHLVQELI